MYHITVTIPVSGIRTNKGAEAIAEAMIEHLGDTFNDNNSLKTNQAYYRVEKIVPKRKEE